MKIAILLNRIGFLKWYAPLIDEALHLKYPVEIWLDHRDISATTKWYEFPDAKDIPKFSGGEPKLLPFKSLTELDTLIEYSDAEVVFSLAPPRRIEGKRQVWVHLATNIWDSICTLTPEALNSFDAIFTNTDTTRNYILGYYIMTKALEPGSALEESLRSKLITGGNPQYDHFSLCSKEKIQAELGVPQGHKVVTLYGFETSATFWAKKIFHERSLLKRLFNLLVLPFSYPYFVSAIGRKKILLACMMSVRDRFKFFAEAFTCPSNDDVIHAVREFCNRNGYFMIMKYRKKNPVLPRHRGIPDLILEEDTEYYPYTAAKVISASDLVITFYSSAVVECAFRGVPVINITPDEDDNYYRDNYTFYYLKNARNLERAETTLSYNNRPFSLYNFSNLVWSIPLRQFFGFIEMRKVDEFKVSEARKEEYTKEFIKDHERECSSVILEKISKRFFAQNRI